MRFAHLADLHIGRRFGEFSMLEDQAYTLGFIIGKLRELRPDALLISGDIYDKPTPSEDAVNLADDFITRALEICPHVCLISGNHDSLARLSFASRVMSARGLHMPREFTGSLDHVDIGGVSVWMLPHIRPREVARYLDDTPSSTGEAIEAILRGVPREGSIIMAHQFVIPKTGDIERCDSEIEPVGGLTAVDGWIFDGFSYAALGHLHKPQKVADNMRYAGSPIKYSFSESGHKKSFVMGEISPDGSVAIDLIPIPSLRDVRIIEGRLEDLLKMTGGADDYICAILTDEIPPVSPASRLGNVYSRVVTLNWHPPSKAGTWTQDEYSLSDQSPKSFMEEFFRRMNSRPMSGKESDYVDSLWRSVEEERL